MFPFSKLSAISLFLLTLCLVILNPLQAQQLSEDEVIETVITASEPEVTQTVEWQGGNLRAEITFYPCTLLSNGSEASYQRLDIINSSTNESQFVTDQVNYCSGPEAGIGASGLSIIKWSNNATFLYFTDEGEGSPDGFSLGWMPSLSRIDLETMEIEGLGQAQFSPINTWLVVWDRTQISILPADEKDGERTEFPLLPDDLQITSIAWMPDESGLVYLQANDNWPQYVTQSAVTHIDIQTQTQTMLLEQNND